MYRKYLSYNIRQDLIAKELDVYENSSIEEKKLKFYPLKISNSFIDRLFNNYYTEEYTEHFYDADPKFNIEEYNKAYRYKYRFSSIPENQISKYREAYLSCIKQRDEFENTRLTTCLWIEVFGDGIWHLTQEEVDKIAKRNLKWTKRTSCSPKGRLFWAKKDDYILIYYYGRDFNEVDFWWVLKRRKKKIK